VGLLGVFLLREIPTTLQWGGTTLYVSDRDFRQDLLEREDDLAGRYWYGALGDRSGGREIPS
jgi:hypothetical protein